MAEQVSLIAGECAETECDDQAAQGYIPDKERLIPSNHEISIHEPNEEEQTILHSAVEDYLENKCAPNRLRKIEILLKSCECDVNALNSQKETVLHLVCGAKAHENLLLDDLLKILLEYRVDLNHRNNLGKTALLIACENGNTNIVRTLLTLTRNNDIYLDADAYDKPDEDETMNDNRRFEQMSIISDFNLRGEETKWIQTYSFDFKTWKEAAFSAIENSFENILQLLLHYDVVVQRQWGPYGETIFEFCISDERASENVRLKLCEKFLESGEVNVNALDFRSRTALRNIAFNSGLHRSNHLRLILNFAKTTCAIDARDALGRTALMQAAMGKFSEGVEMLLKAGASVDFADNRGFTVLHHALNEFMRPETWVNYGDFPRNIQELNQRKAREVILYETKPRGDCLKYVDKLKEEKIKIVKLLLESNIDVNSLDCEGYSPMDIAEATIPEISSHIKDALKAKGASLNVFQSKNEQSEGHSHLNVNVDLLHRRANFHRCVIHGRKYDEGMCVLIAEDDTVAQTNFSNLSVTIQNQLISARDHKGRTPLHRAIISGQQISHGDKDMKNRVIDVVKLLIPLGCSVNETDIYGRTPLHYADFKKLKNFLISHGADQTAEDENGINANELSTLLGALRAEVRGPIERIIEEIHKCMIEIEVNIKWNTKFDPITISQIIWRKGKYAIRHPSVNHIGQEVNKFIKNLAAEVTKRDWRFAVDPILVGSSYEEAKLDLPDEFDFNFVLRKIGRLCEVMFSPELPSGFVRLKRKHSENYSVTDKDFDSFFDSNSILMIEKLNARFQIILRNVLSDAQFIENHPNFDWDLDLQTEGLLSSNPRYVELANTLKLRNMKLDHGERNVFYISIDIVPCIHIDGWWPDEAISNVSEGDIKAFGCNLVFDQPQRLYRFVPYSKSCVKISFARAESEVIKQSPNAAKQAYMIAKQLIKKSKRDTAYILKNSFLYCIEAFSATIEKESELTISQDALESKLQQINRQLWLEGIMKCHLDFVSQDFCPCYFMPDFSIPCFWFLKDIHMRHFTDDEFTADGLFEAYRLYRSVSLHASGLDFQIPSPDPVFEHFDREAMIANLRAFAMEYLGNAQDIYVANETEPMDAAHEDNDEDEEEDDDDEDYESDDDDDEDEDDDDDSDNGDSGGSGSGSGGDDVNDDANDSDSRDPEERKGGLSQRL